ncbi:PREDICTED: rho GTPase-activating protein 44-like [Corvus brachyrhynchos]|uniref:rho GTPase-activating protein 44-like n=1 Tax=Corvus brachyrhynchos TaxID=85066 RepID=UPI0008163890|nr:PREDICTED: rho GTPase-activating protein 44-like [Corvus brachyrhynchos]
MPNDMASQLVLLLAMVLKVSPPELQLQRLGHHAPRLTGSPWHCLTSCEASPASSSSPTSTRTGRLRCRWPAGRTRSVSSKSKRGPARPSLWMLRSQCPHACPPAMGHWALQPCLRLLLPAPLQQEAASPGWGRALGTGQLLTQAPALPPLLQELLAILHQEGPTTEGIFQKEESTKARQELRQALDHGLHVDMKPQPVLLLAMVLKDFLRSIPGKLLVTDLYEDWTAAMQMASREDKICQLKEVAKKLPARCTGKSKVALQEEKPTSPRQKAIRMHPPLCQTPGKEMEKRPQCWRSKEQRTAAAAEYGLTHKVAFYNTITVEF